MSSAYDSQFVDKLERIAIVLEAQNEKLDILTDTIWNALSDGADTPVTEFISSIATEVTKANILRERSGH